MNAPAFIKSAAVPVLQQDRPIFGIALINLAVIVFTSMDAVIKGVSETFPTGEIVFFRNLFAFGPILAFMIWQGGFTLRTRHAGGHLLRGLFGVSAMYFYFLSYKLLPLSDAIALGLSGPIFLTILSIPFLGERVGVRRWSACIVGFIGVLIVLRPSMSGLAIGEILGLSGAFLTALVIIVVKQMSRTEPSNAIVAYMVLLLTPMSLVTALPFWSWPADVDWVFIIGMGLAGTVGHVCWTRAISMADASVVVPFDYVRLIFTIVIGMIAFAEHPDAYTLLGSAIIVLAGIYIARREAMLNQRAAREAVAASGDPARTVGRVGERDAA